jgi:hypothetical protein
MRKIPDTSFNRHRVFMVFTVFSALVSFLSSSIYYYAYDYERPLKTDFVDSNFREPNTSACHEEAMHQVECLSQAIFPLKCLHAVNPSRQDLERMQADGIFADSPLQKHLLTFLYERGMDLHLKAFFDWRSKLREISNPNAWILFLSPGQVLQNEASWRLVDLLRKNRVLSSSVPDDVATLEESLQKLDQAWNDPSESFLFYRDDPDVANKFPMAKLIFQRVQNSGNCMMMLSSCFSTT